MTNATRNVSPLPGSSPRPHTRQRPLADAVEQTVRWYRAQASPSSAADQKRAEQVAPGSEYGS
jgi:hypothetical protein